MTYLAGIRTLGFGSVLGAGLCAFIYVRFPGALPGCKDIVQAIQIGALIGAGVCQLIDKMIGTLIRPLTREIGLYVRLLEIWSLKRHTGKTFTAELTKKVVEEHFSGKLK